MDKEYLWYQQNAWYFNFRKHGHLQRDCDQATKSIRSWNAQCLNCRKYGHLQKYCKQDIPKGKVYIFLNVNQKERLVFAGCVGKGHHWVQECRFKSYPRPFLAIGKQNGGLAQGLSAKITSHFSQGATWNTKTLNTQQERVTKVIENTVKWSHPTY